MERAFGYLIASLLAVLVLFFVTVWLPSGISMSWVSWWEKTMMVVMVSMLSLIGVFFAVYIARDQYRINRRGDHA